MAALWENCLVISPHLDDAVLSCGLLLAARPGTMVATVFAGVPAGFAGVTSWDARSGFGSASEAVAERRREDAAALAIVGARALWCDLCDSQYGRTPSPARVAAVLHGVLRVHGPDTVLFPAGLFHSDHELVHEAALAVRARHPQRHWILYEDALYRRARALLQQRLVALAAAGIEATPVAMAGMAAGALRAKRHAAACYRSQLRALDTTPDGVADAFAPEGYWRLEPAPPAQRALQGASQ